jgi:hypothetical protein
MKIKQSLKTRKSENTQRVSKDEARKQNDSCVDVNECEAIKRGR